MDSKPLLERFYNTPSVVDAPMQWEICIDEAGRGCLFGRVFIACVVLPKDPDSFSGKDIKDSKKFSSKKKILQVADYIKQNALAYSIQSIDETVIDDINILQAVMRGMHDCIRAVMVSQGFSVCDCMAVVDGNYFVPFRQFDDKTQTIVEMSSVTVEQGDAKYIGIAAASILAKTARDEYVLNMCIMHPDWATKYGLNKNMGYGTKLHLDGIKEHGISEWHRKTFGICRNYQNNSSARPLETTI